MKKIKLKFKHEFERDAFYDRAWCHLDGLPQCATCARNKYRYENWNLSRAYTSFGFSDRAFEDAKKGDCPMFVQAKDINVPDTLPAWCKVGRLVFHNGCLLGKIEGFEEVSEEGSTYPTTYVVLRSYDRHNKLSFTRLPKQIQPVRFRPYTYEEAKKLLGKVMEVPEKEGFCGIDLICSVSYDRESGDVLINGGCFKGLSKDGCLIDGLPIGVPEVDEEALKGGD